MNGSEQSNQTATHQHNFNDEGIHVIYCCHNINGNICEYAQDKKTGEIGKFVIVNRQGRLDYSVCYDKNNSIDCCHKKDERCECKCHTERKRELEILGVLIFDNPCTGCKKLHKQVSILTLNDYQKLCMTHREVYDETFPFMTFRRNGNE